MEETGS